ncbi:putative pectate lyase 15 [Iris pallida]|uniref:Pectate lyase 15 n=1 Tax=Iris pallida TaxID=29817 RepID=A0AAX6E9H4_IRIPA|nr:putative pectate lyase 15 [Iris pallida]
MRAPSYLCYSTSPNMEHIIFPSYLMERNNINALHGQVTIVTLILQFLRGTSGILQGVISMTKLENWRTITGGDAVSIFGSSHIWVDQCLLSRCTQGLVDVVKVASYESLCCDLTRT